MAVIRPFQPGQRVLWGDLEGEVLHSAQDRSFVYFGTDNDTRHERWIDNDQIVAKYAQDLEDLI